MANLLEKLIALVSNTGYESKAHHTTPVYTKDSSGLTGVEKYLEKQERALKEKALASATGVEKYLQKQAMAAAAKEKPAAPAAGTTGVEKYLEKQAKAAKAKPAVAAAPAPTSAAATGVEKYLGKKSEAPKAAPAKKEKPSPAPASTGVGKYLEKKVATPEEIAAPVQEEPVSEVTAAPITEAAASSTETAAPVEQAAAPVEAPATSQCQASTLKGTQCKNTTNLSQIQRTINKKKYLFTVCKQHSNDAFKPYSAFVESE